MFHHDPPDAPTGHEEGGGGVRDFDGWFALMLVVVAIGGLMLGFGVGVDSVKKDIGRYGCAAVEETWKGGR